MKMISKMTTTSYFFGPPLLPLKNYLIFFWLPLTVTGTPQLMLNRKWYQASRPEMEFHMINMMNALTNRKDNCTLTKHTRRWTYSAVFFYLYSVSLGDALTTDAVRPFFLNTCIVCTTLEKLILFGPRTISIVTPIVFPGSKTQNNTQGYWFFNFFQISTIYPISHTWIVIPFYCLLIVGAYHAVKLSYQDLPEGDIIHSVQYMPYLLSEE